MYVFLAIPADVTKAEYTTLTVNEFSSNCKLPVGPQILIPELIR